MRKLWNLYWTGIRNPPKWTDHIEVHRLEIEALKAQVRMLTEDNIVIKEKLAQVMVMPQVNRRIPAHKLVAELNSKRREAAAE